MGNSLSSRDRYKLEAAVRSAGTAAFRLSPYPQCNARWWSSGLAKFVKIVTVAAGL